MTASDLTMTSANNNKVANRFVAVDWTQATPAAALANGEYMSFTVTPDSGYKLDLDSLDLVFSVQDGNTDWAVYSSADNFTTALASGTDIPTIIYTTANVDLSAPAFDAITAPLEFRVAFGGVNQWVWAGLSTDGNFVGWPKPSAATLHGTVDLAGPGGEDPKHVKVFLMAGQSNMEGHGHAADLTDPSLVDARSTIWYDEASVPAITNGTAATDWGQLEVAGGTFGPEMSFATAIQGSFISNRIAIVKVFKGGTSSAYWAPGAVAGQWGEHVGYLALMDRIDDIEARLNAQVTAGDIDSYEWSGFLWMQGEDDSNGTLKGNAAYINNTTNLFAEVRTKLGTPDLPIVLGRTSFQLDPSVIRPTGVDRSGYTQGDYISDTQLRGPIWYSQQLADIRAAQTAFADTTWVDTDDLPMTDAWHFDGEGQITFGNRLAAPFLNVVAPEIDLTIVSAGIIGWTAKSNWVFDVYWTGDLAEDPFSCIASNLAFPTDIYTDTVHSVESAGFYKVKTHQP